MAKAQILVVEDEGIIAQDIQNTLKKLGYAVPAIAYSGKEGIEKAQEIQPDLVLMDIVLGGGIDGIEAAEQIRRRFHIPVVYLTAYADEKTLERAKITEPFGYILKPFEEKELYITIEMALYKHEMERRLKESQQWLTTTLKSIGDAVIATDINGCVIFMNPIAESLTGWKQKEASGKHLKKVFNIINEKTGKQVDDPVTRVLREGIVVGLANHTILISKDGTRRSIDDSGAPIKDENGKIIGVVLVFRDVSEKRRIEQELMKADKLNSLGILAGGVAHDFNNILTAILGNIILAKEFTRPGEKIYERLIEAEKASLRAKGLAQQLLTFSSGGAPIKKTMFISELLKESALFALSGSNVQCEFSISNNLWAVEIDEGQINQAINNLIINAIQSMPEGGRIKLTAENVTVSEGGKKGRYVKISIVDQGIGIPKEHLPKIFEPYFTTKQKGSGLGLAIVYSIIKKHGGYIEVETELGVGTTFKVYLPASLKNVFVRKGLKEKIQTGKGKILVMDDEELVRKVVGEMLVFLGYEVEFAEEGIEAIELYKKAKAQGQPFDVIIMDLTIPIGMGGKETINKLLEIDPTVKAIVSSGYSTDPVMTEFTKYGFKGFIIKPFKIKELGEVLYRVIMEK
ncbi:multi-sensor hybrid histidine kinase [Candidatus Desulfofervidus auxilii]|uniref:histidine kinase n=2 Tax=Bacteria TaxID=2 RepID=A0A7U4QKZ2_DESA2|nr:response regulator [Candidatus Desulfofervidus auxilii]AMM41277.1 multi-sensor hybrid histidine kinase [Candidatus Desulfofervidus auxilii]